MNYDEPKERAYAYAERRQIVLGETLGFGQDGIVLATDVATAVKSLKFEELYKKELAVYLRLRERHVDRILGFSVPKLVANHDELLVIKMEFVTPPYVLDFASAGLDQNPLDKYEPEQVAETMAEWSELFGDYWPQVKQLYYAFRGMGIYLADLNTGNIRVAPTTATPKPS